ncbi:hypothetical protein [Spirulina sp. 06S082]|nr:hypothetical protein [Spirulina sp. 06S082]MEA5468598.1 hypothetical protein [Spirulina sp. 06S082]
MLEKYWENIGKILQIVKKPDDLMGRVRSPQRNTLPTPTKIL